MSPPLLLSVFPTFAVGGAQIRFTTLVNQLGDRWRHAIVAMDGVTTARERLDPALQVVFPDVGLRKGALIGNIRRVRAWLRQERPGVMLTHNFGAIEWAIANHPALVRHLHVEDGFGPEERDRQIPRRVWLRRVFLRGRTTILPSRRLMRLAADTWRLPTRQLRYVPNGIDLARFGPEPAPGHAGPIIGTVAALRAEKNIGRLIRAFAEADPAGSAQLMLIGDGAERPSLERLAGGLGIAARVCFAGHRADPADALRQMDIFAMSSDTEQMPISLLEAMATGLPVAATDVGDIRSMLPDEAGRFVTPCDDAALAGALRDLLADGRLRAELGRAGRHKAEQAFGQETMVARWAALLDGETEQRNHSR